MLIIGCTVSGHHHALVTEQHAVCCSSGSWSIIHSQYLPHVPHLQRSKIAESADGRQEHLLCTMSLCPSSLESPGCVKMLLFLCVEFCHRSSPYDFLESVARRTRDFPYRLHVVHCIYSGDTDFFTGSLVYSLLLKS